MIDHFLIAQEHVIDQAIEEIESGKKVGHWIWYVFPQMKGLGKSGMSQTYAIKDRQQAYYAPACSYLHQFLMNQYSERL